MPRVAGHSLTVCRLEHIPENSGKGYIVSHSGTPRRVDIVVVRRGDLLRAYHNICPHKGLNLDWAPDRFMDPAGEHLQCANHDALFRFEDGYCVSGSCLRSLPVRVKHCDEVELGGTDNG
jgi:nitrite reductase/ring-hydroxylating ferredoxin subunit